MACEDGQESHLQGLADRLDQTIAHLKESFGEIGDQRLTVMAAIVAMDEAAESRRRLQGLETENLALKEQGNRAEDEIRRLEADFAARVDLAAQRIETLAATLTATKPVN